MKKPKLSKKENEVYLEIIACEAMEDLFIFGYEIGRERVLKEMLEDIKEKKVPL